MLKLILGNLLTLTIFMSNLIVPAIFIAGTVWVWRQTSGQRAEKWKAFGRDLIPVFAVLAQDAQAIGRNIGALVQRDRILRKTDLDADLRDLLKGKD